MSTTISTVIEKPKNQLGNNVYVEPSFHEKYEKLQQEEQVAKTSQIQQEIIPTPASQSTLLVSSLIDAVLRGLFRFPEKELESWLRPVYRFGTEFIRKGSESSVIQLLEHKNLSKDSLYVGLKRALENAASTIVLEPNLSSDRINRVVLGFGNMVTRFGARLAMFGLNLINKDELKLKDLHEEFFARSFFRLAYFSSSSTFGGIAIRSFEQFLINSSLHLVKPASKLIALFNSLQKNSANKENN